MALSPEDIQNKSFTVRMRGFDQEEVNKYLDSIVSEITQLTDQQKNLEEELSSTNERLREYQEKHDSINHSIIVAQDAADRLKEESNTEADKVLKEANEKAETIVEEAENNADQLLKDGVERARKIEIETEELRKQTNVFRKKLTVMIENQLDAVNNEEWEKILSPDSINEAELYETDKAEQELRDSGVQLSADEEAEQVIIENSEEGFGDTPAVELPDDSEENN